MSHIDKNIDQKIQKDNTEYQLADIIAWPPVRNDLSVFSVLFTGHE